MEFSSNRIGISLVICSIVFLVLSIAFVQCSERKAQKEIDKSKVEIESIKSELAVMNDENERLREVINRANDAVERALNLIDEAHKNHERRIETVEADTDASDWLACELPDSVRNVFKEYCKDTNITPSEISLDPM